MTGILDSIVTWLRLFSYLFLVYSLIILAFSQAKNGKHDLRKYIHLTSAAVFTVLGISLVAIDFYRNLTTVGLLRDFILTPLLLIMTVLIQASVITESRKEVELEKDRYKKINGNIFKGDETHGHSSS